MDSFPTEVLIRILWYCFPHMPINRKRNSLVGQIWPVLASCRSWCSILTDPHTIPIGFRRIHNLGLLLHITRTKLTKGCFAEHFVTNTVLPTFFASYHSKKWRTYAPFLIPQQHDLIFSGEYHWSDHHLRIMSLCYSCKTADSFFHLYHLFTNKFINNDIISIMFTRIIWLIHNGNRGFQLKHANWCYRSMITSRLNQHIVLDNPVTYKMLIKLGWSYHKTRRLFQQYVDVMLAEYQNELNYCYIIGVDNTATNILIKVCDTSRTIIQCYCQLAYKKLHLMRNIDRIMEEISFYEQVTKKPLAIISPWLKSEKIIDVNISTQILALKYKWEKLNKQLN